MCTHDAEAPAVQGHPTLVLTVTDPDPPPSGTLADVGLILKLQPELCVTVNVRPAIVSVPLRAGPVVEATLNCTVPFPLPEAPLLIVIQAALLVAVHSHAATVATETDAEPPAFVTA